MSFDRPLKGHTETKRTVCFSGFVECIIFITNMHSVFKDSEHVKQKGKTGLSPIEYLFFSLVSEEERA